MTLDQLASPMLWISLLLLLASVTLRRSSLAAGGWALFGLFWLSQPAHFLEAEDYFNVALVLGAALLSFYMAGIIYRKGFSSAASWASYAAAVCGIVYFPFAEVAGLRELLIGATSSITAQMLSLVGVPVIMQGWNIMSLNGHSVEIVLGCTAIESIALFAGVILSVKAPLKRRLVALAASTITIYALNIVRNGFVLTAYGYSWFGADSFNIAHNIISKAGSTAALIAISYFVLLLLPELLDEIDGLAAEIRHPGGEAA